MTPARIPAGLARLNAADEPSAAGALTAVCASTAWVRAMIGGRPYAGPDELCAASDAATARLAPGDLAEALAGHPPIGRPAPGDATSAREQGGVGEPERAELLRLGLAYQERHGQVFLIRAAGRTGAEMLAALRERIANDPATEREIVRGELAAINRLRLARLTDGTEAAV